MKPTRLLVVDDHSEVVDWLVEDLGREGYDVKGCTSGKEALDILSVESFDLLVADVEMPGMRGLELMATVQRQHTGLLVLLITAFGSVDLAVQAVRAGACDFVTKPFSIDVLLLSIERALRDRRMRREIVRLRKSFLADAPEGLVARSAAMRRVLDRAIRAARTDSCVLLTGETGTGKGTLAAFIHARSPRAKGIFLQLNCATLPLALAESELFGVRRGAFTDARADRDGLFARAHGGTLFLDEVGELGLDLQPKLLQVLETGRVRPLGGGADRTVDVRVIAATNRSLEDGVRERTFRADLLFRLDVIRIDVPPLRERPDDIDALVDCFLDRIGARLGRHVLGVTEDAMAWLRSRPWPGNARELANAVERAIAFADHDTLALADFADEAAGERPPPPDDFLQDSAVRGRTLEDVEMDYIRAVIDACAGNMARAARRLGIDRRTLYRRLVAKS
jgi:DNA-binding NtrC family response regulator